MEAEAPLRFSPRLQMELPGVHGWTMPGIDPKLSRAPLGGLTVAETIRAYGRPGTIAELDRVEADLEAMRGRTDDIAQKKWLNSMALFSRARREVCADELVPGRLILSWQPRDDPAAERQTLRADRCAELRIPWMGRGTEDGYLNLNEHCLYGVLIHPTKPLADAEPVQRAPTPADPREAADQFAKANPGKGQTRLFREYHKLPDALPTVTRKMFPTLPKLGRRPKSRD
jgi:hypothetical protein